MQNLNLFIVIYLSFVAFPFAIPAVHLLLNAFGAVTRLFAREEDERAAASLAPAAEFS